MSGSASEYLWSNDNSSAMLTEKNQIIFCHFYVYCLLFPKYCAFSLFKLEICLVLSFFLLFWFWNCSAYIQTEIEIANCVVFLFFFVFHLIGAPILLLDGNLRQFLIRKAALKSLPLASPFVAGWSPVCAALLCRGSWPGVLQGSVMCCSSGRQSAQPLSWVTSMVLKSCSLTDLQYSQFWFVYCSILEIKSNHAKRHLKNILLTVILKFSLMFILKVAFLKLVLKALF